MWHKGRRICCGPAGIMHVCGVPLPWCQELAALVCVVVLDPAVLRAYGTKLRMARAGRLSGCPAMHRHMAQGVGRH